MSVTADEINLLVRRHLQESGYLHTAYVFSHECVLPLQSPRLPPQALVTILRKGMLYMQMEKGLSEKARAGDPRDAAIASLLAAVHREEPIVPARASRAKPPPPPLPLVAPPALAPVDPLPIRAEDVLRLRGHFSDVYCGSWTRDGRFFATGSGDATATIWEIRNHAYVQHYILDHATQQERSGKDIATLAWDPSGTVLATGCCDGSARLWTVRGELKCVLACHSDPVFTVQFSPDGSLLLTGGSDQRVVAWSVATGERRQIFQHHQSRVLDVDWLDNQTFASCSGDTRIALCAIGRASVVQFLEGHKGEVNKIAWDSSRRLLASCSDDRTVRVWRPFDRMLPILLNGHTHHVYTIRWQPGTDRKILASGAFDNTVRIWDVLNQSCLHVLARHANPIYTIGFSPRGRFFVSAGIDNVMNMWRTQDVALVATYDGGSGIFEAQWDHTGMNIALCLADSSVIIISTKLVAAYQE
jgi:transducin (beta)-like 1